MMTHEIARPIVFVVGAGASADFQFPVGSELAMGILNKLDLEFSESAEQPTKGPLRMALDSMGFTDGHRAAARQLRIGMGPAESIDQFLFRRKTNSTVRELGLMAIADIILECERNSVLNKFDLDNFESSLNAKRMTENSWPSVLLDQIIGTRGPDEIGPELFSDIGFVIFNYDRCVEQVLFHQLHRRHDLTTERALEVVRSIPMLHVYGVLGDPFDGSVPFGASSVELASVARRLQTYHEEITDTDRQAQLDKMMSDAEKVCFLGFGFLEENFVRLFPDRAVGSKQLSGTSVGAESSPTFRFAQSTPGSDFSPDHCTPFIRAHADNILHAGWFN